MSPLFHPLQEERMIDLVAPGERSHFLQFVQSTLGNVQMKDPNQVIGEGMSEQEPSLVEEAREAYKIVDGAFQQCREARSHLESANEYVQPVLMSYAEELTAFIIAAWSVRPMLENAIQTACNAALNRCIDILWAIVYMDSVVKSVEVAYSRTEQALSSTFGVYKRAEKECSSS